MLSEDRTLLATFLVAAVKVAQQAGRPDLAQIIMREYIGPLHRATVQEKRKRKAAKSKKKRIVGTLAGQKITLDVDPEMLEEQDAL